MRTVIGDDVFERRFEVAATKGELEKAQPRQQGVALLGGDADGQERLYGFTVFEEANAAMLVDLVIVELLHIAGGEPCAFVMNAPDETSRLFGRVGL